MLGGNKSREKETYPRAYYRKYGIFAHWPHANGKEFDDTAFPPFGGEQVGDPPL